MFSTRVPLATYRLQFNSYPTALIWGRAFFVSKRNGLSNPNPALRVELCTKRSITFLDCVRIRST